MISTDTHRIVKIAEVKGLSKRSRVKTEQVATCSCGWTDPQPPVDRRVARQRGDRHVYTSTHLGG